MSVNTTWLAAAGSALPGGVCGALPPVKALAIGDEFAVGSCFGESRLQAANRSATEVQSQSARARPPCPIPTDRFSGLGIICRPEERQAAKSALLISSPGIH